VGGCRSLRLDSRASAFREPPARALARARHEHRERRLLGRRCLTAPRQAIYTVD